MANIKLKLNLQKQSPIAVRSVLHYTIFNASRKGSHFLKFINHKKTAQANSKFQKVMLVMVVKFVSISRNIAYRKLYQNV